MPLPKPLWMPCRPSKPLPKPPDLPSRWNFYRQNRPALPPPALPCGSRPSSWPHSGCPAAEKYRTAAEARTQLEQRWQWVSALAATAGGTLNSKQKIKLEAYIQMNYLDRILRHANTRLMQMTAGQYELERIGAENQRSQSGLDLGIIDHYNGTRRSVKTLSGGESFKASLALALGLSDEVQSAAGGIRLDTLFLDEGFGSLDDESLEQAMRVLAGLTEGDRLVGIISHVGALKDRIDRQVVVRKARTGGSTVELIV